MSIVSNIKKHDVQRNVPPDPEHMLPQAFGTSDRISSLIRSTRNDDPIIRLKAVTEIAGAVHREEDARLGVGDSQDMVSALISLMHEDTAGTPERSAEIRTKATEALATLTTHSATRAVLTKSPATCVPPIMDRMADTCTAVRAAAYTALERLVSSPGNGGCGGSECAEEALRRGVLGRLVSAAYCEDAMVRERALLCLQGLCTSGGVAAAVAAVGAGAVRALLEVVGPAPGAESVAEDGSRSRAVTPAQAAAARALLPLVETPEGRRDLVALPAAVAGVATWLEAAGAGTAEGADERSVQTSAAATCACAALEAEGKRALLNAGATHSLLQIIRHTSPGNPLLLHAVQAMACLAELPAAREALREAVPALSDLEAARTASDLEVRTAARARQVITWTP